MIQPSHDHLSHILGAIVAANKLRRAGNGNSVHFEVDTQNPLYFPGGFRDTTKTQSS